MAGIGELVERVAQTRKKKEKKKKKKKKRKKENVRQGIEPSARYAITTGREWREKHLYLRNRGGKLLTIFQRAGTVC